MNEAEKTAWIDKENKIVSFHAIDNGEMIMKTENLFWDFLFGLTSSGYIANLEIQVYISSMRLRKRILLSIIMESILFIRPLRFISFAILLLRSFTQSWYRSILSLKDICWLLFALNDINLTTLQIYNHYNTIDLGVVRLAANYSIFRNFLYF